MRNCASGNDENDERIPKKKKDQLSLAPVSGKNSPANRPDPDGPGGLGAEESGTERTGSTQDYLVASQRGGRWAEVGQQYDSSNVPVTRYFPRYRTTRSVNRCGLRRQPVAVSAVISKVPLRCPAVSAIMSLS